MVNPSSGDYLIERATGANRPAFRLGGAIEGHRVLTSTISNGPFVLSGPIGKPDPRRVPVKGDIAHIALAGQYFVPHYVVPMQRMAGDCGANLREKPSEESEILWDLGPGVLFELLDTAGDWAWGCVPQGGLVGWVRLADIEDPFA